MKYTQPQIARALGDGWSRDRVADHISLKKIGQEAWKVIVATFASAPSRGEDARATQDVADATHSPFTEGLLRHILDLGDRQQLLLCSKLAKGKEKGREYTKKQFASEARQFQAFDSAEAIETPPRLYDNRAFM